MTTSKTIALSILLSFLFGAVCGRFTVPSKTVTEEHSIEVKDTVKEDDEDTEDDSVVVQVKTVRPDGTVITQTEKHNSIKTSATKTSLEEDRTDKLTRKEVTVDSGSTSIFALAAFKPTLKSQPILWGGGASKRLLGPITGGIFVLSDTTIGVTVGVTF